MHPPVEDFEHTRAEELDRELARRKREAAVYEAKAHIRAQIKDRRAQAWWDRLPNLLGPLPIDGQGWADRAMRFMELAMVSDIGLDSRAVANYEQACMRRAAILEPRKYGKIDPNADDGDPVVRIEGGLPDA